MQQKKYKLIKKYPGSPKLGYILEQFKYGNNAPDNYYCNGVWLYPSKESEFWEEIIEKDYEILSFKGNFKTNNGLFVLKEDGDYYYQELNWEDGLPLNDMLKGNSCSIHSVKRLSDGEIFTVGDLVSLNGKLDYSPIKTLTISNNTILINEYQNGINYYKKYKQPLFTTEDGVEIFEHNKDIVHIVGKTFTLVNKSYIDSNLKYYYKRFKDSIKVFSTKELAENYILMNKPCLSINDINKILCFTTVNKNELIKLVKEKLK